MSQLYLLPKAFTAMDDIRAHALGIADSPSIQRFAGIIICSGMIRYFAIADGDHIIGLGSLRESSLANPGDNFEANFDFLDKDYLVVENVIDS